MSETWKRGAPVSRRRSSALAASTSWSITLPPTRITPGGLGEVDWAFVGRVRHIQIPAEVESGFQKVQHYRATVRGKLPDSDGNRRLIAGLGGEWHQHAAIAAPLVSGDRVAAVLYADNPSGRPLGNTEALEIFLQQAGLAMDRAFLERKLEESRRIRVDDAD